jgi:hypothetical protein
MNTFFVYPPQHAGEQELFLLWGNGPASYNQATGDIIFNPGTGENIEFPMGCTTKSGNFTLSAIPSAVNTLRPTWAWLWEYSGAQGVLSVVQLAAGSGMTPGTYIINGVGGSGSGAQISVTVLTATTIATPIVLKAGQGYGGSVPTFTVPSGTSPTFTVTAAPLAGIVPNATNLSAELVQFGAIGGQL